MNQEEFQISPLRLGTPRGRGTGHQKNSKNPPKPKRHNNLEYTKIKISLSEPLLKWIQDHLSDSETKSQLIERLILKGMEEEHKNEKQNKKL